MKHKLHLTIVLIASLVFSTYAQKGKLTPSKQPISAKSMLNDNLIALKSAVYSMKKYKKKTFTEPYLALAYDYQQVALQYYEKENYEASIYHALKSRKYALMEVKRNKGRIQENHRVLPAKLFKYFEKDEQFFVELKEDLYNYKTPDMPSIDQHLDRDMKLSTENPDIHNAKLIREYEQKSKIKY